MANEQSLLERLGLAPVCVTVVTCLPPGNEFPAWQIAGKGNNVLQCTGEEGFIASLDHLNPGGGRIAVLVDIFRTHAAVKTDPVMARKMLSKLADPVRMGVRMLFFAQEAHRSELLMALCGMNGSMAVPPLDSAEDGTLTTELLPQRYVVVARVGIQTFQAAHAA
jgi:hypothetical protein